MTELSVESGQPERARERWQECPASRLQVHSRVLFLALRQSGALRQAAREWPRLGADHSQGTRASAPLASGGHRSRGDEQAVGGRSARECAARRLRGGRRVAARALATARSPPGAHRRLCSQELRHRQWRRLDVRRRLANALRLYRRRHGCEHFPGVCARRRRAPNEKRATTSRQVVRGDGEWRAHAAPGGCHAQASARLERPVVEPLATRHHGHRAAQPLSRAHRDRRQHVRLPSRHALRPLAALRQRTSQYERVCPHFAEPAAAANTRRLVQIEIGRVIEKCLL